MKKIFTILNLLLLSTCLWAVEFNSSTDYEMGTTLSRDGVTVSGLGSVQSSDFRLYKGATLTITSTSGNITAVAFEFTNGSNNGGWNGNNDTYSETGLSITSWSKAATSGSSGKQARITKITVTVASPCTAIATVVKGAEDPTRGTFTIDPEGERCGEVFFNVTVTPTPAPHYSVYNVSATGGIAYVTNNNDGTWTVRVASSTTSRTVTVNASFVEDAKASVTTSIAGSSTTDADTYYVGDTYTLPLSVTDGVCGAKTFVGWSTVPITTPTDTKPTSNFYARGAEVTLAATQTFYAVFAQQQGSASEVWTETSLEDISSTDVFVLSDGAYAASHANGSSSNVPAVEITVSDGKITSAVSDDIKWTLTASGSDYTFYPNGSTTTWLYCNTTSASGSNSNTRVGTGARNTFAVDADGYLITNDSYTDRYFSLNSTVDFRFYTTTNYGAFVPKFYVYGGGATYKQYATTCVVYDVTVSANDNAYGNPTYSLGTISANPVAGYRVKTGAEGYTLLSGTATITNNGDNTLTVVAESDCSIRINYELIPTYTVNWYVAGSIQRTQTDVEGTTLTGIPSPDVSDCDGEKVFVGWLTSTYSGDAAPSGLITSTAGMTMPGVNTDYHAVFASIEESATIFKRVTDLSHLTGATKIVIVNKYGNKMLNTDLSAATPLSEVSGEISPTSANIWTLESSGSYWKFKSAGNYLGIAEIPTSGSINPIFTSDNIEWEIGASSSGTNRFYIKNAGGNVALEYYSGWKVYKNESFASSTYFADELYVPAATYTGYTTACTPCTVNPGWSFATAHAVVMKGAASYTNTIHKTHASTGQQTWTSSDEAVATVDENGTVTPLVAGTAIITLKLSRKDDYCAQILSYEFEVRDPTLEVVEVKQLPGVDNFGIIIEHDLPGAASITLSQETTHQTSESTTADSLFFSKYFEADSDNKLIALYNGTKEKINLSNYKLVRTQKGASSVSMQEIELDRFGHQETGWIYPDEEIIILRYAAQAEKSAESCASTQPGYENWYVMTATDNDDGHGNDIHQWLQFSGPQSIGLYSKTANKYIDVIGATSSSTGTGHLMQINASNSVSCAPCEHDFNDGAGFYAANGDNIKTELEETDYELSTNRCLLIRKRTVKSGMNAVAQNVYTKSGNPVCDAEIAAAFKTLADEWAGFRIGSGSNANTLTCEGLGYVGGFDYVAYRVTYDTIAKDQVLDDIKQPDGTYLIEVPDMKSRACGELKIEIHGAGNQLLNAKQFRVPIIVDVDMATDDARFNAKKDTCKTCDVIVMNGATLTKIDDNNSHWGDTAYNVDIYAGGKLVVPASKEYRANNVTMRTRVADDGLNMIVPEVVVDGNIVHAMHGLSQRIRVGTNRFYAFSVPFEVRLSDISFSSGEPAVFGTDYMIRVYDGESRAASQVASGNWKNFTGDRLLPGHGYTIALAKRDGHAYRELILPMYGATLVDGEAPFKNQTVFAWGWNTGARANHIGWNYVGNPYLRKYAKNNLNEDAQLKLTIGALVPDPDNDGWYINDGGSVPYVTQINADRSDYSQHLVSATDLPPFTPFFIQVGVDGQSAGDDVLLSYVREHRVIAAPARRNAQIVSSALVSVLLQGNETEDNFGVVVGDNYTPDYDMMADLSKEFGSKYSLKAYTLQDADQMRLAFNAVNTQRLSQPIPVGVRLPGQGYYSFAINENIDMSAFEHIYLSDNVTGIHTDLLDESYVFSVSGKQEIDNRFALSLVLKPKAMPTACEENWAEHVFAEGRDGRLRLSRLPAHAHVYIYDVSGRLMADRQFTSESNYSWPLQAGVYEVRVVADGKSELIKTIVK